MIIFLMIERKHGKYQNQYNYQKIYVILSHHIWNLKPDHPNAVRLDQTKIYEYYKEVKTYDEYSFYHKRNDLNPADPLKVSYNLYQKEKIGDYIKSSIIIEWHNQSYDTLTGNFNWKKEEIQQLWVNNMLYEGDPKNVILVKN